MAILAHAAKRGITLPTAYIVVVETKMQKYLRPTLDAEQKFAGNESAVQYSARVQIYANKDERNEDFGGTPFTAYFTFPHRPGADLTEEAYAVIRACGLQGWELTNMQNA